MIKRPRPSNVPLPKTPPPPKKPAPVKPKAEPVKGRVSSVREIFAAFFRLCKQRLLPVLATLLLSMTVSLLLLAALGIGGLFAAGVDLQQAQQFLSTGEIQKFFAAPQELIAHPFLLSGGAVLLLAVFLLCSWCYTAMLAAAVDEQHGIFESLCMGWKYLFPMLWVSMLFFGITICWLLIVSLVFPAGLAVLASLLPTFHIADLNLAAFTGSAVFLVGAILFLLLMVLLVSMVPLSMSFGFMAMIDEGLTDIDALLVSRLYVRGHWWDTFFKLLLIFLLLTALTLPLSMLPLFMDFPGHQFVGQLASLVTTPLMLLYMTTVYRDLKQATGRVDPDSSCRCLWRLMAAAGMLLPPLAVIGAGVEGGPEQLNNLLHKIGISVPATKTAAPAPSPAPAKAPAVRTVPSVDGLVIWRDPLGDARNPLLDLKEVSALGKQGELVLTVSFAQPLAEYFAAKDREPYAQAVSFYFDVDSDQATGAELAGAPDRAGYDLELAVLLAAPSDAPEKGRAYPSLYALGPQKRQSLAPLADSATSIADNTLTIRLPYERLDAAAGRPLKVCFRETTQKEGSGLSTEQTVPLH